MQKCVGCRFYDRNQAQSGDKGARWGQCRRTGPIIHPLSAKTYLVEGIWPHVRDDDWCGEWSAGGRGLESPGATEVMNSLMTAAPSTNRPLALSAMLASGETAVDARQPMTSLMRNPHASD